MNIRESFFDAVPFKRKSATDWMVPAFLGLGVGLGAGYCVGLLYAPELGEDARLRLREGASRMKERAAYLAERARGQVSSAAGQLHSPTSHS